MILPEDRPESPSKLDPPAPATAAEQQSAPPAYPGHEASGSAANYAIAQPALGSAANYGAVQPAPSETQRIVYVPVDIRRGPPAGKRFCRAFTIALLVYFLLAAITSSIAGLGRGHGWSRVVGIEYEDLNTAQPTAKDGVVLQCIKGPLAWPIEILPPGPVVKASAFHLDRLADALYVFSRGLFLSGNIVIVQDERIEDLDEVIVEVTPLHNTLHWLHAVSVCALMRSPQEMGIGIFAPTRWRSRSIPGIEFEIVVRIPKLPDNEVLQIARFETNAPHFTQHIGDLNGTVLFRELSLKSSNSHISSQSVNAIDAEVMTSNSRIDGHYEVSESLRLSTSNQIINVTATMVHRDPELKPGPVLKMKTSNARIDSSVNLISALPKMVFGQGGSFVVEANTSNARLALDFPSAPVDSRLSLYARTSNNNARVQLHPTYEGQFTVKTSKQAATLNDHPVTDPSGRNRTRRVTQYNNKWTYSHGMVLWDGMHMGNVHLETSNGRAELDL
ncbi:hypothetical protein PsYK624_108790 [Phanerochaete sordida]|uniref:Uncharacterized protein n=1 Tax=Phanerochaete sordida TaxID=48140 RepID=A0A9P3LH91_9APHY|nr:hypothetical protein PsYK624_108790 [Phanerochaete sordida]